MVKIAALAILTCLCNVANADWVYGDHKDAMTSKASYYAILDSSNSLNLDFPYRGHNYGHLQVRKHPQYGLDVIFRIDKGQILCSSYNGCPIEVRFDDAPPMRFEGTEPADNSSDTVFIKGATRFIAAAKKAKRILVRVNIYHSGAPVLEFYVSKPLEWTQGSGGAKTPGGEKSKAAPGTTWPPPGKLN